MEKKVLLIADDDEMNRKVIHRFLKNKFEVLEARDGQEALDVIHSGRVDALLLDIIMPKVDGLEVLKTLTEEEELQSMGILVATSTKEKTERTALSLGADDVVSKPYDPIVIQRRLDNILMMKELQAQKSRQECEGEDSPVLRMRAQCLEKAEKSAEKLHRIATVIEENSENKELMIQMAAKIHCEAAGIVKVFSEERGD